MNKNYLIYPCKVMRITQNYKGKTSHLPYSTGKPADYPVDEACEDSGKSYMYCPCDKMTVKRVYGVGSGGTNTVWLESTEKVFFADGTTDYCTLLVTHPDDSALKNIRKGQVFTRKERLFTEGKDGATGNHFHFSAGKGRMSGNGWIKNSKGKWVLDCEKGAFPPEKLFYLDKSFTRTVKNGGLSFSVLPPQYEKGSYRVTADLLNVRTGPGTDYKKKSFSSMSEDAQRKILILAGYKADGYVKGLTFTVLGTENNWGRTPSGWVCLDYCEAI